MATMKPRKQEPRKTEKRELYASERHTLLHVMRIGLERIVEHGKVMREAANAGGNVIITELAARRLADEYDRQAKEVSELRDLLANTESITIVAEPEEG